MAKANKLRLYGPVGFKFDHDDGFTAASVARSLDGMEGPLEVTLNSGGGLAWEGVAIYDQLKNYDGKITIRIEAAAFSAASIIAMAGDEVIMGEGSFMMIHNASIVAIGEKGDLIKTAKMMEKLDGEMADIYARNTGLKAKAIKSMMDEETWMTAAEAVADGFATSSVADEGEPATAATRLSGFDLSVFEKVPAQVLGWFGGAAASNSAAVTAAQLKDVRMFKEDKKPAAAQEPAATPVAAVTTPVTAASKEVAPTAEQIRSAERERVTAINSLCRQHGLPTSFADELVNTDVSKAVAAERILDKLSEQSDATASINANPQATVGLTATDKFIEGATLALMAKTGLSDGPIDNNEFTAMTLSELARASQEIRGTLNRSADRMTMVGAAFMPTASGHTTSDFAALLANVANKAMLRGAGVAGETFQEWTSEGVMTDYKTVDRLGLDHFPSLQSVEEGAEYKYVKLGEHKEQVALADYGNMFAITRQAIINDDLNAFSKIPMRMGQAAIRTIGNLVCAVLTTNATMGDGTALFHADHNNLAASGGAPSVTTLGAARAAMALQKDRSGNQQLNIRPKFILAPVALQDTIAQILASEYDPSKSTRAANVARNMATLVTDARLDAAGAAVWH